MLDSNVVLVDSGERQTASIRTMSMRSIMTEMPPKEEAKTTGVDKATKLRFYSMFFLIGGFFLVELIVGILSRSITLLADSMHMLSDVIALVIGFWAVKLGTRQTNNVATYGFKRAEVVGALINGVFLLTVCFNIVLESVHRFIEVDEAAEELQENIDQVIIVGAIGLGINVLGLIVFATTGHGHSHGGKACTGHGHSHGGKACAGHGHSHGQEHMDAHSVRGQQGEGMCTGHGNGHDHAHTHVHSDTHSHSEASNGHGHGHIQATAHSHSGAEACGGHDHAHGHSHSHSHSHSEACNGHGHEHGHGHGHGHEHAHCHGHAFGSSGAESAANSLGNVHGHSHGHSHANEHGMNVNLRGVFLHMMGDALGSIGVMLSALVIKFVTPEADPRNLRFLADPLCSLLIVAILLYTTLPFVFETCRVLMQTVPEDLDIATLRAELLNDTILLQRGLVDIHDFHIWSLNDEQLVGTLHAVVSLMRNGSGDYVAAPQDSNALVLRLKEVLGGHEIEGVTIQVEFVQDTYTPSDACSLPTSLQKHPASFSASYTSDRSSRRRGMASWASVRGARFSEWASSPDKPKASPTRTGDGAGALRHSGRSFGASFGASFKRSFAKRSAGGGGGGRRLSLPSF